MSTHSSLSLGLHSTPTHRFWLPCHELDGIRGFDNWKNKKILFDFLDGCKMESRQGCNRGLGGSTVPSSGCGGGPALVSASFFCSASSERYPLMARIIHFRLSYICCLHFYEYASDSAVRDKPSEVPTHWLKGFPKVISHSGAKQVKWPWGCNMDRSFFVFETQPEEVRLQGAVASMAQSRIFHTDRTRCTARVQFHTMPLLPPPKNAPPPARAILLIPCIVGG